MNIKNKILTFFLFLVNINWGGANPAGMAFVVKCMEFMKAVMLPTELPTDIDGIIIAFCADPTTVSYPFQLKNEPFGDRIRDFLDETADFVRQTEDPMLKILTAFMHDTFAKLEPEREPEHLQEAKRLYEQGTSDEIIQQVIEMDPEFTRKMQEICGALKQRGLANLSGDDEERYKSVKLLASGSKIVSSMHQTFSTYSPYLEAQKQSFKDLFKQLIKQPVDDWRSVPEYDTILISGALSILHLDPLAPFINQIAGTTDPRADVSRFGKWSSLLCACNRYFVLSQQ